MNLSLQQLFGANAYQNSESLVIDKRDFINLSAADINTGESLLVAILLNVYNQFEGEIVDEHNNAITDELGRAIAFSNSQVYELLNIFYWRRQFLQVQSQPKIIDTFVVESNEIQ